MATGAQINEPCFTAEEFPAWHYAEVTIGSDRRVVSVFHMNSAIGALAYWYDDPENPHRALPLLKKMDPVNLGDYGSILQRDDNMDIFVALCKAIEDLPDPLYTVQAILWIRRRNLPVGNNGRLVARQALNAVERAAARRRRAYDRIFTSLCGPQAA